MSDPFVDWHQDLSDDGDEDLAAALHEAFPVVEFDPGCPCPEDVQ